MNTRPQRPASTVIRAMYIRLARAQLCRTLSQFINYVTCPLWSPRQLDSSYAIDIHYSSLSTISILPYKPSSPPNSPSSQRRTPAYSASPAAPAAVARGGHSTDSNTLRRRFWVDHAVRLHIYYILRRCDLLFRISTPQGPSSYKWLFFACTSVRVAISYASIHQREGGG